MRKVFFLVFGCGMLLLSGCAWMNAAGPDGCGEPEVVSDAVSPDGALHAYAFGRTCERRAFAVHVSIIKNGEELPDADGNVARVEHVDELELDWKGPRELGIGGAPEEMKGTKLDDVDVKMGWGKTEKVKVEFDK